jgi:hypothetical protein
MASLLEGVRSNTSPTPETRIGFPADLRNLPGTAPVIPDDDVEREEGEMRRKGTILATATVAAVLTWPGQAAANGGAYLELDKAHYLPGEHGTALTYVSVPERKESIFELGPFYLFALPEGMTLAEHRPIPASAVRIGTFSIEEEKHQYELSAAFTIPQLAGDFYTLQVCNDPCTVSGFRESLSGTISIVATQREAELLTRNSRLQSRVYRLAAEARRTNRRLEAAQGELQIQLANTQAEREQLTTKIDELEAQLSAAEQRAADAARPPMDPWVMGGILALVAAAAVLTFWRRRLIAAVSDLP